MSNQNGLISARTVFSNGDSDSNFFVKNTDPVVVRNLIAENITCDQIDINGGVITTTDDGTVLEFNGVPLGTGNVATVGATAPLASTGGVNPVISINDSGVVANTYTLAQQVGINTILTTSTAQTQCKISNLEWETTLSTMTTAYNTVGPSTYSTSSATPLQSPVSTFILPVICPLVSFYQGTNFASKCSVCPQNGPCTC